ncbi:hypothetical protein TNCV_2074821 [Trichonephila clavipes]|nr:hypothetical protein TNCV_2074821 [Trichonephila clavipes]
MCGLANFLIFQKWPRDRAAADFRIATGHGCLSKHLNMIGFAHDQSRFTRKKDSRRACIWRKSGARFYPSYIAEDRFDGKELRAWSGIMLGSRTPLRVFDTVNAQNYSDEVPEAYVRLFRGI